MEKRKRFDRIFPIVWTVLISLAVIGLSTFSYLKNHKATLPLSNDNIADVVTEEPVAEQVPAATVESIASAPPKHSGTGKIQGKSIQTSAGLAVAVSEGELSSADISRLSSLATEDASSSVAYTDTTGRYPSLGNTLISYLKNNLLWSQADISYMYEIRVVDCAECNYGGLYTGSYLKSGNDITKAFGYITLNALPYKDDPHFTDYMKLTFAHEYGHHYTLYHRWVDLDIQSGTRFPDAYYSVRPLPKSTTTFDYSLGWENCDAEVLTEDYSYLYSGYGYHGMAKTYGYPSPATKDWLVSLSSAAKTTTDSPTAAPAPSVETAPADSPVSTPAEDNSPPEISILEPLDGAILSGKATIRVSAWDNVGITKVELYFEDQLALSAKNSFSVAMNTLSVPDGEYTLTVKAYDLKNVATKSIKIIIKNSKNTGKPDPATSGSSGG